MKRANEKMAKGGVERERERILKKKIERERMEKVR